MTAHATPADAITWLFNNEFMADIAFAFPENNILYAHSLILSTRSDHFYNHFKSFNRNEVSIVTMPEDIDYKVYFEFLQFIYTGDCILTDENVEQILGLAIIHKLKMLESRCKDSLEYAAAELRLAEKRASCTADEVIDLEMIGENFCEIIASKNTSSVSRVIFEKILKTVKIEECAEVKVFNAAMQWATNACIDADILITDKNRRKLLGEEAFQQIRFQDMTAHEFGCCVAENQHLFTPSEISSILHSIMIKGYFDENFKFARHSRVSLLEVIANKPFTLIILNDLVGELIKSPSTKCVFTVSQKIALESLCIWAHTNDEVSLRFQVDSKDVYEKTQYTSASWLLYACHFDRRIILVPGKKYTVIYSYKEAESKFWCRANPPEVPFSLEESGVTFQFLEYGMNILRRIGFKKFENLSFT